MATTITITMEDGGGINVNFPQNEALCVYALYKARQVVERHFAAEEMKAALVSENGGVEIARPGDPRLHQGGPGPRRLHG